MVPLSPYPPSCSPCAHTFLFYPPEKKRIQLLGNRLCALRGCFSLEKVSSHHGEWGSGTDGCLTADRQHWLSSLEHWPPSSSVFPRYCILLPFLRTALLGSSCIYLQAYMLRLLVFFFYSHPHSPPHVLSTQHSTRYSADTSLRQIPTTNSTAGMEL